jgi:hypothetical protein
MEMAEGKRMKVLELLLAFELMSMQRYLVGSEVMGRIVAAIADLAALHLDLAKLSFHLRAMLEILFFLKRE